MTYVKTVIPYDLKRLCVQKANEGMTYKDIYKTVFLPEHSGMTWATFRVKMTAWRKKAWADEDIQNCGTFPGMTAHAATVQVTSDGRIAQAWIKESAESVNWDDIIEQLQNAVTPVEVSQPTDEPEAALLEVPLFDLHFGVAKLADYRPHLARICGIIERQRWEQIRLIVGRDCLHTNDFRGHTARGTNIDRVDIPAAWADAWTFWSTILLAALRNSAKVFCHYSRGNHDECLSWAFFKALEAAYPDAEWAIPSLIGKPSGGGGTSWALGIWSTRPTSTRFSGTLSWTSPPTSPKPIAGRSTRVTSTGRASTLGAWFVGFPPPFPRTSGLRRTATRERTKDSSFLSSRREVSAPSTTSIEEGRAKALPFSLPFIAKPMVKIPP